MKFLVNKLNLIIFLTIIFSDECLSTWTNYFSESSKNKIIQINAIKNDIHSKEYIDIHFLIKDKVVRIDINNQILFFDQEKSRKIFKDTKQVFIDNPDSGLINLFSILSDRNLIYKSMIKKNNVYYLSQDSYYPISLEFNLACNGLNRINIHSDNFTISIEEISIFYLDIEEYDKIMNIEKDYFEYDLRNE